jgi:nucleotide-binding universal stress UspA family protein
LLPKSEAAMDRAGMLAEHLQAQLSLLHVVSPSAAERNLERALQLAISGLDARARAPEWRFGPPPQVSVRAGSPARLIVDSIDKNRVDLLVIGPHRKRGLRDVLEGTIAEKILNTRQCPLLIVRKPAEAEYKQVMLALEAAEESAAAIQAAESLVLSSGSQAMVLHVNEPPYQGMLRSAGVGTQEIISYVNHSRREAAAEIRELLKRTSVDHSRYGVVIGESHPARAIRRAVEMYQPDLLVMGTSGGRVRRALIGSVASQVMDAADCDVLVVPRGSVPVRKASLH